MQIINNIVVIFVFLVLLFVIGTGIYNSYLILKQNREEYEEED